MCEFSHPSYLCISEAVSILNSVPDLIEKITQHEIPYCDMTEGTTENSLAPFIGNSIHT
jgi:hypothetical protein